MQRPPQHQIGDLGEILVAQHLVEQGWVVNKLHADYGFDYLIQVVKGRTVTSDFALVQVKAVRSRRRMDHAGFGGTQTCRVSDKHLRLWNLCPIPCFLALVDVQAGHTWFLDAKDLERDLRTKGYEPDVVSGGNHAIKFPQAPPDGAEQIVAMANSVTKYWNAFRAIGVMSPPIAAGAIPLAGYVISAAIEYSALKRGMRKLADLHSKLGPLIGEDVANKLTCDLLRSF